MASNLSTITLDGGPDHGQVYFEDEFRGRIRAAQRMGHTHPDAAGSALGYAPGGVTLSGGKLWAWQGVNCHPADPADPDLAPFGAAFAAEFHASSTAAA
ncbi:hypothetical protein OHA70_25520 [Kribbella sp. NBC_00382]|uniref:hypothetical protein n=1 Tax=Kribbella sp. NBC_00382 TaxID=2975967 RepID=UPI002E1E5FE3